MKILIKFLWLKFMNRLELFEVIMYHNNLYNSDGFNFPYIVLVQLFTNLM